MIEAIIDGSRGSGADMPKFIAYAVDLSGTALAPV